jgi:flagellar motor protein MotB
MARKVQALVSLTLIAFMGIGSLFSLTAFGQERNTPGNKDHPLISRYPGSEIKQSEVKEFDSYRLLLGSVVSVDKETGEPKGPRQAPGKYKTVEGKVTRINYLAPAGRSALEVFANYEQALRNAGANVLYRCEDEACGKELARAVLTKNFAGHWAVMGYNERDQKYLVAQLEHEGVRIHVVVFTVRAYSVGGPMQGRVFTQLDIVEGKPMEGGLVRVDASAWAQAIATQGKVALYGIYFDTDKAEVKPESKPTLAEITKLLKQDPSLKLYVVGHTDAVGSLEYNLELSRRRAEATVKALTSEYGVDPKRLKPFGVGPLAPMATNDTEQGRAKNRRVELVKQ